MARCLLGEQCEATADPTHVRGTSPLDREGRCTNPSVAMRWEQGFGDAVCEKHGARAEERGALVLRFR
jgi:hypothetical protein